MQLSNESYRPFTEEEEEPALAPALMMDILVTDLPGVVLEDE